MRHVCVAVVAAVAAVAAVLGGCGEDDPPPRPASVPATPSASATNPQKPGNTTKLPEKAHIEGRVACPIPEQPSDPQNGKCDIAAPACGERLYCLQLQQGTYCEPCPERDGIRHVFRDRDFVVVRDQTRDPFQSFLFQPGIDPGGGNGPGPTERCKRKELMVATDRSYLDLKLVGIVAQGTQRKVLMIAGPEGYIIKRDDCVGKEKAIVKEIGEGFVTFELTVEGSTREPELRSVQLNPKQLTISDPTDLPVAAPRTTIQAIEPPPATLPQRGAPAAPPASGSAAQAPPPAGTAPPAAPPARGAAPR